MRKIKIKEPDKVFYTLISIATICCTILAFRYLEKNIAINSVYLLLGSYGLFSIFINYWIGKHEKKNN